MLYLKEPVEGDPEKKDVRKVFDKREDAINDPVGQPTLVIVLCRAFYRLYSETSYISSYN